MGWVEGWLVMILGALKVGIVVLIGLEHIRKEGESYTVLRAKGGMQVAAVLT